MNLQPVIRKAYDDALEKYDVLVMPTLPYAAPKQENVDLTVKGKAAMSYNQVHCKAFY